jgi:N-methylhydantoinase A
MQIGIDIGGTFTDLVLLDGDRLTGIKVLSTRPDPSEAVVHGLRLLLTEAGGDPRSVERLAHGTTVGTNAMIERSYARCGLVTTEGFRDLLEIGSQRRPSLYDLFFEKPRPPVERAARLEIAERITASGEELRPVDPDEVVDAARVLAEQDVECIAVCLLHAYASPEHEREVRDVLAEALPGVPVWLSSDVLPEYREFERLSTTVVNAALGPVMSRYLELFEQRCGEAGVVAPATLMQSNGGALRLDEAAREPGRTLLSGPAAGVLGAIHVAAADGFKNLLTLDMGGTSTDISLVRDGEPTHVQMREVAGYPVRGATLDISAIGAGGGSIAWVDTGGRLCVGPQSAGSVPGPAAYGRGGTLPTVTDANIVTGRLAAALGGHVELDVDAAHRAIAEHVAEPLGLTVPQAAQAILEVVTNNMALAARLVSVARGHDPADYALVAYGGAGALHAVAVAEQLHVPTVFVPPSPGTLCALGLLVSDLRRDFSQTRLVPLAAEGLDAANAVWSGLAERVSGWTADSRHDGCEHEYEVDLRFRGQHHELTLGVDGGPWSPDTVERLRAGFTELHELRYGFAAGDEAIELVCFRQVVSVPLGHRGALPGAWNGHVPAPRTRDALWSLDHGFEPTAVVQRKALRPGDVLAGPAIVEQDDSTIALPPGYTATTTPSGALVIQLNGEPASA